jgi:type I restriction enzyme M protein
MTRQELDALIKKASDLMRSDDNTKLVTKYIEQLSWLLFLKVHEAMEEERHLLDPTYAPLIDSTHKWSAWAHRKWRPDDLIAFVNTDLLPYLRGLNTTPAGKLIATLFQGITTVMKSGVGLQEVCAVVDKIDFHSPQDIHTFSVVYESLLAKLGRDASWSGEHYTPRPIVRFVVQVVDPKLGERIYDPAAGSAGFLAESFEHMRKGERTVADYEVLRNSSFYGQESGELPFLLGTMNMILHGVSNPNIKRINTLEEDIRSIPPARQYEVVLTNPPFGGRENSQIQQNFPLPSGATELLFLQHLMAYLKKGGRAGVVIPDGILFRDDSSSFVQLRKRLVDEFRISAIVRLPLGAFPFAPDTRTNLIFFSKAPRGAVIRYYQLMPPPGKRNFTKTRPITDELLAPALAWVMQGIHSENAWEVKVEDLRRENYDLDLLPPEVAKRLDPTLVAARVREFTSKAAELAELTTALGRDVSDPEPYRIARMAKLGEFIEERGNRAKGEKPTRFIGVSNKGGLVPFKGAVGKSTARYPKVEVGDFVYNPMRVNVGSIALCRSEAETGFASAEYVVFRVHDAAPFSSQYLLAYLQSSIGLRQIDRNAQGTIRSRLYFENLAAINVPIPHSQQNWIELLSTLERARRLLHEMPSVGPEAVSSVVDSLFFTSTALTSPSVSEVASVA